MTSTQALPRLMVAPNGARRGKSDHPALPITLDELVATASACRKAGAEGLHLHVRDEQGVHSLDVGLYREAMAAIEAAVPDLFLQVTSEAAGLYGPEAQIQMIRTLQPRSVSLAPRELLRPPVDRAAAKTFYTWARDSGIAIHHITYSPAELQDMMTCIDEGIIPGTDHQIQLVIGSYAGKEPSRPEDLDAFLGIIRAREGDLALDWMVCAFGSTETACLAYAAKNGGKMRVGFENSLWNADGSLARDNAERVTEVLASVQTLSPEDR